MKIDWPVGVPLTDEELKELIQWCNESNRKTGFVPEVGEFVLPEDEEDKV
jgi:hypothetical protein